MLKKIISGGQTGVDQSALRAALDCDRAIGGWCPPGRVCESGAIPALYSLRETPLEHSPAAPGIPRSQRTEWNVRDADACLILLPHTAAKPDQGSAWTLDCAERFQRPHCIIGLNKPSVIDEIHAWLSDVKPTILNVAGPAESLAPGIGRQSYRILREVFGRVRA